MKKIIVNADDFGLTEAVTLGIISGHCHGIISSTSLMVNMPFAKEAVELAKQYPSLGLGIHLNVTAGKPISDPRAIPSLVTSSGNFYTSNDYRSNKVEIQEEDLLKEFKAQIELFIKYTGNIPDHIDCHHMYDFFGLFPRITDYLITTYRVPMRLEQKHLSYSYPIAKKVNILSNSNISEDEVCEYLQNNLKADLIELPNHAGFVDYELMKISSLNVERVNDLHICKSEKIKSTLNELGYKIIRWSEII
jgi:predicted glycoside hydrolase/deacetylase ChbG (UPF0249 family)